MTEPVIDQMMDTFATLIPVFMKAIKQIQSEVLQGHDLSNVHMQIMFILNSEGQLNMSALGKKLMAPKPNVTVFIDKLIEHGHVERLYSDADRRIISIRLTEAGRNRINEHMKDMKNYFKGIITRYSEKDLETLKKSLEDINFFVEKYKIRKENHNG